jgi:rubrerythrin
MQTTTPRPCTWCGAPLAFSPERGWHHGEGGTYVMRCDGCGWTGAPYPSPQACPSCGARRLRDDHCALPS